MSRNPYDDLPQVASFEVTSDDIHDGQEVPQPRRSDIFGAGGEDISPQLSWRGFPTRPAASRRPSMTPTRRRPRLLALGRGRHPRRRDRACHRCRQRRRRGASAGRVSTAQRRRHGSLIGAAPPPGHGRHDYYFVVHAVDVESLAIGHDASPTLLGFNLFSHTLGRGMIVAWYAARSGSAVTFSTGNSPCVANWRHHDRGGGDASPEVFVRELSPEEGARLTSISRKAKYQSKRQRAIILLASSTGMSAPQIAAMARTDESHVRKVIHAFNERGFGSLDPDYRGGRPKKATPEQRDRIVAVARARPDTQGVALTRWSLAKLREHLPAWGSCSAGRHCVRRCARRACRISAPARGSQPGPRLHRQDRASWGSTGPQARRRGRGLLRRDGPDRVHPASRLGLGGRTAARAAARDLLKNNGARYLFGAYDVHADRLHGRLRAHRNSGECSPSTARSGCATTPSSGST